MASPAFELELDDIARAKPSAMEDLKALGRQVPIGAKNQSLEYIAHWQIHPDPAQPRKAADAGLWESIAKEGLLEPIVVRLAPVAPIVPDLPGQSEEEARRRVRARAVCPHCAKPWVEIAKAGDFLIVNGERRWRSSLGILDSLPAIVRLDFEATGRRLLAQVAANAGRPLSPIEEADAYAQAIADDSTLTHAEIAAIVGKSRSSVTDRLALLKNVAWLPLLRSGEITVSQMLELSRHADAYPEVHEAAIEYIRRGAELDAVERIAEVELVEFRAMVARAYADPTEVADPPTEPTKPADDTLPLPLDSAPATEPAAELRDLSHPRDQHGNQITDYVEVERITDTAGDSRAEEQVGHTEAGAREASEGSSVSSSTTGDNPSPRDDDGAQSTSSRGSAVTTDSTDDEDGRKGREPLTEPEAASAGLSSPSSVVAPTGGGMFTQLVPLLAERAVTLTIAPGRLAGALRVNVIPSPATKGEKAAFTMPLTVEGTPAELDEGFAAAIASYLAARPPYVPPPAPPAPAPKASATKTTPAKKKAGSKKATTRKRAKAGASA